VSAAAHSLRGDQPDKASSAIFSGTGKRFLETVQTSLVGGPEVVKPSARGD